MNTTEGRPGNGAPHGPAHFGQRIDHLGESAQQLVTEARTAVNDLVESVDLRGRVNRHPYGMVAAAAGIGYVLGGGLFTPLTGRVLRLGLRLAALPFIKDELIGLVETAVDGLSGQGATGGAGQAKATQADLGGSGGKVSDRGSEP